jgi:hypothetical protein
MRHHDTTRRAKLADRDAAEGFYLADPIGEVACEKHFANDGKRTRKR